MKKKILFIVPYPFDQAPSQRLKFEQYYDAIRNEGYEISKSPFISGNFRKIIYKPGGLVKKTLYTLSGYLRRCGDLFRIRKYDLVYIHLWVTPLGFPFFEWLFCLFAKKVIYDIDDLIYLGSDVGANPLIHTLKGRMKPSFLMKRSDHVIVCTPRLEEYARKFSTKVTDISSTINTEAYQPVNPYSAAENLTLGWSGSHSTSKYLHLLQPVLSELSKKLAFKLLVIGDPGFRMEGVEHESIAWTSGSEVSNLQRIDIGLYPLPDEEWVYGKSGLKALQYMALGIPTVATAIGANFRIIEHGKNGFLVNSDAEWLQTLEFLIRNPEMRRQAGMNARKTVEDRYSVKANTPVYLGIIDRLLLNNG